jgi:hypothetical protein
MRAGTVTSTVPEHPHSIASESSSVKPAYLGIVAPFLSY